MSPVVSRTRSAPALDWQVAERLDRLFRSRLYDVAWLAAFGHLAALALIAVLTWDDEPRFRLETCIIAVLAGTIVKVIWLRRAVRSTVPQFNRVTRLIELMHGLTWGVGAALVLPMVPINDTVVIFVALSGILAGSLNTLSADPVSYIALIVGMLAPLPAGLLVAGTDREHFVLTGLALVFGVVLASLARWLHRALIVQLRTEAALSTSEAERSLLLDSTAEGIYGIDLEGRCTFCNAAGLRTLGFSGPADVLGRKMHPLIHHRRSDGSPLPEESCAIYRAIREGRGTHVDSEVFWRADGSSFETEYWSYPIRRAGVVVGAVVTFLDISQRKRAEAALIESEARFRWISDSNIVGIGFWDSDGRITEANDEYLRTIGYTREDLDAGRINFRELTPPRYAQGDQAVLQRLAAGEKVAPWEKELVGKDGQPIPVVVGVAAAPGKVDHGIVFQLDISERRRIEAQVRWRTAVLEAQLQATVDGVLIVDDRGRKVLQNRRFLELWGITAAIAADDDDARTLEEVLGKVAHPDSFRARVQELYDHPADVGTDEVELADGRTLERYSAPVNGIDGEHVGRIWVFHDVTEHKAVAAAMREARDLAERAATTRSMFLANMSHEIRTPMNAILGMIEIVLDTDLTAEQRHSLDLVRSSAESLLGLLNDILDYSKIEAGRLDVETIPFDLVRLIDSTASLLAVRAREKQLELAADVSGDLPSMVLGDPSRLRQVLTNLIGNAIKFTDAGDIVVSAAPASTDDGRRGVRIAVRDTGIGISADRVTGIFDEFTQADGSTSRRYGGTGLGLTIAQRLVRLMGGTITVTSEVGRGSEFAFVLPLAAVPVEVAPGQPRSAVRLSGSRILVVDDNRTNRRILRNVLTAEGSRVVEAESGVEGLARLRTMCTERAPASLAIIDVQMPGMDGFELAEEIRADEVLGAVPLLMLTSAAQRGDAARCRELGVNGYAAKPIPRSDLLELVAAVLGGKEASSPRREVITRHSLTETRRPLHVLLAEDNLVNQEVATTMLRKRGHRVDTANNGREAVAAVRASEYDLILMDIQMPEMDGFEATAAIRALGGPRRLPIVALTAHALSGERERCLAHDMDGYLAKPFKAHELFAVVEALGAGAAAALPDQATVPSPPAAVDLEAFREQLHEVGAESALDGILDTFLSSVPERLDTLRRALANGTPVEVAAAAHALRSSAGAICATPLAGLMARVEAAGRSGNLSDRRSLAEQVQATGDKVLADLRSYRGLAA